MKQGSPRLTGSLIEPLTPREGEILALLADFSLSNQEIADRLRVSLATVKIRLHRARGVLYGELRRNCRCYQNARGELMGERMALTRSRFER